MEGQSNWYHGEAWIKEHSADILRAGREAQRDTQLSHMRRNRAEERQYGTELDRELVRLLGNIDRLRAPRHTATLRQRFGSWMLRLVGGHP